MSATVRGQPGFFSRLWKSVLTMAGLLAFAILLFFVLIFLLARQRIPMVQGENGLYGQVEINQIPINAVITEFTAVRVPSRILGLGGYAIWPVPEIIEVQVEWNTGGKTHNWNKTYLLACTSRADCRPVSVLSGLLLYSPDKKGKMAYRGYKYFLGPNNPNVAPETQPTPAPSKSPPPAPPYKDHQSPPEPDAPGLPGDVLIA